MIELASRQKSKKKKSTFKAILQLAQPAMQASRGAILIKVHHHHNNNHNSN
jgi:hypothetical protein